jgi:hypothetical protein
VLAVSSIRVSLRGVQHAYASFACTIVGAVALFMLGCAFVYCGLVEYISLSFAQIEQRLGGGAPQTRVEVRREP